jgi:hypothetical protein
LTKLIFGDERVAKSWSAGFFGQHHHPVLEQLFDVSVNEFAAGRFARLVAMVSPPAAAESPHNGAAEAESVAGLTPQALPDGALTHEITVSLSPSPDGLGASSDYLVSILASSEINFVLDTQNQLLVAPSKWPFLVEQMAGLIGPAGASADAAAILSAPDLPLDLTPITIPGH